MEAMKYEWPSTVNVTNFVTAKPYLKGDDGGSNFKNWKEQMLCMLESQGVVGFVDGEIRPPPEKGEEYKLWRRTDRLVKGWILGSIGDDVLDALREKRTARDAWLEMDNIFIHRQEKEDDGRDFSKYLRLYRATLRGDWETAKNFFGDINELSTTTISSGAETALHIAVLTGKSNNDFVANLVEIMPREALASKNSAGETALHNAAVVGNTPAAKALLDKNPDLLHISNSKGRFPVLEAAANYQRDTLEYLISEHKANDENTPFQGQQGIELLNALITNHFVDIALELAHRYPALSTSVREFNGNSALAAIAQSDSLFPKTETFTWWQRFIYHRISVKKSKYEVGGNNDIENLSSGGAADYTYTSSFQATTATGVVQKVESPIWHVIQNLVPKVKELREMKSKHQQALDLAQYLCNQIVSLLSEKEASEIFKKSIIKAAEKGCSEIVAMIIHEYPMVIFDADGDTGKQVFLLAATYRFENVINLIHAMSDRKYMIFDFADDDNNNLMHKVGKLAPPDRLNLAAGAALQMQRELQWFHEMEKFVRPSRRQWPNKESETPQTLFTKEHAQLKAEGEQWMKDTANACTISAALIATVMFAAAFTVPGGLDSSTGTPLFTSRRAFEVFAFSDAISLFASLTSLLVFLSILTARYAEGDFLYVLPRRLSVGLLCLFVSIAFMLVAFGATLYLVLRRDIALFGGVLAVFASFPLASLLLLQFPLLVDVAYSIYGPGIFGKKSHTILY